MEKKLKDYQIRAIEGDKALKKKGLFDLFEFYLDEGKTIVFKAPTGSGKTFIMTNYSKSVMTTGRKFTIYGLIERIYRQSYIH